MVVVVVPPTQDQVQNMVKQVLITVEVVVEEVPLTLVMVSQVDLDVVSSSISSNRIVMIKCFWKAVKREG